MNLLFSFARHAAVRQYRDGADPFAHRIAGSHLILSDECFRSGSFRVVITLMMLEFNDARQMGRFLQMGTGGKTAAVDKSLNNVFRRKGNADDMNVLRNFHTISPFVFPANEEKR
jgi:hypothetical protein